MLGKWVSEFLAYRNCHSTEIIWASRIPQPGRQSKFMFAASDIVLGYRWGVRAPRESMRALKGIWGTSSPSKTAPVSEASDGEIPVRKGRPSSSGKNAPVAGASSGKAPVVKGLRDLAALNDGRKYSQQLSLCDLVQGNVLVDDGGDAVAKPNAKVGPIKTRKMSRQLSMRSDATTVMTAASRVSVSADELREINALMKKVSSGGQKLGQAMAQRRSELSPRSLEKRQKKDLQAELQAERDAKAELMTAINSLVHKPHRSKDSSADRRAHAESQGGSHVTQAKQAATDDDDHAPKADPTRGFSSIRGVRGSATRAADADGESNGASFLSTLVGSVLGKDEAAETSFKSVDTAGTSFKSADTTTVETVPRRRLSFNLDDAALAHSSKQGGPTTKVLGLAETKAPSKQRRNSAQLTGRSDAASDFSVPSPRGPSAGYEQEDAPKRLASEEREAIRIAEGAARRAGGCFIPFHDHRATNAGRVVGSRQSDENMRVAKVAAARAHGVFVSTSGGDAEENVILTRAEHSALLRNVEELERQLAAKAGGRRFSLRNR